MKKILFSIFVLIIQSVAQEYNIDVTHSSVSFSIKHLSVADTIGVFQDFEGQLIFDDGKIKKLYGSVKIPSINTFNQARDEDLQHNDFFASKIATLESISFQQNILTAKLTINNISKEVKFHTTITGPILNPSLKINKKTTTNPLVDKDISNNPLITVKENDNFDCGCYVAYGDNVMGIELQGQINRFDFNIATNTPKELLSENIKIKIILEASR